MTILLTRPLDDSQQLGDMLRQYHIATASAPVLHIAPLNPSLPTPETLSGLVVTSRHALNAPDAYKTIGVHVVGQRTASQAKECGWHVLSHHETADQLIGYLQRIKPQSLLYLRGEQITHDLQQCLPRHQWSQAVIYRAVAAKSLPDSITHQLQSGAIHAVVFFSLRSASIFESLIDDLSIRAESLTAFCLSPAIAHSLRATCWRACFAALAPNQDEMIALIRHHQRPESMCNDA